MKVMNFFKFNKNKDIENICKKFDIKNYTINKDRTIDVDGDVYLCKFTTPIISTLPLTFGKVSGDFFCGYNELTSLEGCPSVVGGNFSCSSNQLTSLEGCPSRVGVYFDCSSNKLTSLEGCPIEVIGDFNCSSNKLTNLKVSPKMIDGDFYCVNNELTSFEGCPRNVGGDVDFYDNPVYQVYRLISGIVMDDYFNLIEFQENWNPIRPGNIIILDRLNDYLETFGKNPVTGVNGYECI